MKLKKYWQIKYFAAILLLAAFVSANAADEKEVAIQQLNTITSNLSYVRDNALHIQDEGRIYILLQSAQEVLNSVNSRGLGNLRTLNLYQQLIVKFRFSSQFFEFIRAAKTEKGIAEILTIVKRIREQRGFDEDPFSKILKTNLEQIHSSLNQITKQSNTPESVKKIIQQNYVLLGEAIAEADQGDRPKAFAKATEVYKQVRSLYPALQQLNNNPTTFRYVLEVMGLNEFVAEYSQFERF